MNDAAPIRTLVIETATAACSVALFDGDTLIDTRHQVVGRGHAELLVPMIGELPDHGRAEQILVDVGPGSFTGLRVGIAAAIGLGIGWGVTVRGFSSLPLIAVGQGDRIDAPELAVAIEGGHGEVFVQLFGRNPFAILSDPISLPPDAALARIAGRPIVGNAARRLADVAVHDALPDARHIMRLPPALRSLEPHPLYLRAPDAKLPGGIVPA
ncbi:tRNA (adenosine(37)-N6)-threonylcarbamoyltransferase complex dimerization subunit type 1 TsaB [Sphingomonas sp. AX6]|uniref:tRNA (adenosine(37)-N6)-threonylcarbamoyltransferase complex dimerization subunit type 1 TsaB n=1 Tax=Sphingomonas sp. AX6 TaxID=2653171 RepID=UPI0012EF9F88|nr:tRNA (adenosine(37)-N6)-threonylcarbamoyltransferase complex dimerization subunit type 1 TsaB [Sphingomonas sp. AX6]VXC84027.1 putative Inactive homolog of metal-dependent proteases, molecular chaperone [Sphingomonas sp. AX6]